MLKKANSMCLLEILKKYSDEEHTLKISEIIEKMKSIYGVDIERKTVYDSVKLLTDVFSYDIVKPHENNNPGFEVYFFALVQS